MFRQANVKSILLLASLASSISLSVCPVASGAEPAADFIFRNGYVYTVDAKRSVAQAVAVRNGRIVYVGDDKGVSAFAGPGTREDIDLKGGMLLPGFHDSHVHLVDGGVEQALLNLDGAQTVAEIEQRVKDYAAKHPKLKWLSGTGWSLPVFPPEGPRKELLDKLVPDRPVYISSQDGHSGWANSRALALAHITEKTADPARGRIERDQQSTEPTGTLRESAMELVETLVPKPSHKEFVQGAKRAMALANSFGITSVQEACASREMLKALAELNKSDQLTLRFKTALATDLAKGPSQVKALEALRKKYTNGRLQATSAKIFADGVVEARTASLLESYLPPQNERTLIAGETNEGNKLAGPKVDYGILNLEPAKFAALTEALNDAGFQIHIHAIGDRAVRTALDALESAKRKTGSFRARPHIAHLELVHPDDIARFKSLGITANFQSYWAFKDAYVKQLTEPVLGSERTERIYPINSIMKTGATVVGGSDWTVTTLNPLDAIQVAVTRSNPEDKDAEPLNPSERVGLDQILAAYTINGAYINGLENQTGSIEVGKAADLIVLDRNLFQIPENEIHASHVLLTMVEGAVVYRRKSDK